MKVLVNGASLSAGPWTWPYRLKEMLNCDMTNLAIPAVGNTYVHESTIDELSKNKYDLVLIMWSEGVNRAEWRVNDIAKFADQQWTSKNMAEIKLGSDNNDYAAIQKDWILSAGYLIDHYQKKIPVTEQSEINQLFDDYYSVVKNPQAVFRELIQMISLQGVLKSLTIPYVFMFSKPIAHHVKYAELYNMIDWAEFYSDVHIKPLCGNNGWLTDDDTPYPNDQGNREFARLLIEHLKKKNYV